MTRVGTHIVLDGKNCQYDFPFSDTKIVEKDLISLLENHSMTILSSHFHEFPEPRGAFTGIFLLSESHFSIHTFPEEAYVAVDIFVCNLSGDKSIQARKCMEDIIAYFGIQNPLIRSLER